MAEDTREIRYYKGKKYFLEKEGDTLVHLIEFENKSITRIVEKNLLLTEEQFQEELKKPNFMIDNYNNTEKRTRYM